MIQDCNAQAPEIIVETIFPTHPESPLKFDMDSSDNILLFSEEALESAVLTSKYKGVLCMVDTGGKLLEKSRQERYVKDAGDLFNPLTLKRNYYLKKN